MISKLCTKCKLNLKINKFDGTSNNESWRVN